MSATDCDKAYKIFKKFKIYDIDHHFLIVGYNFTKKDFEENTALTFHRIIEAFQMGYARRYKLGDPEYEKSVNEVSLMYFISLLKS